MTVISAAIAGGLSEADVDDFIKRHPIGDRVASHKSAGRFVGQSALQLRHAHA